jgi:hypothetical protein
MEHVYGSRDHNWRSFHGGLMTMGRHGHFGAQEVIVIAWKETERERERRLSEFSPITPLGAGVTKMVIRRHSTEATSGASMGR